MKVTGIEELSKSRSKVYIDEEFAFVLYKGELRLYHLKEGKELSEKDYHTILDEVLPKRAKLRAMNLLKSREYTTAQLRVKLRQGLYPEAVIERALEYVASYHYTDDLRYAVSYITYHETMKSRRRIEQDLMRKGIDKNLIARAWMEWEEQGGIQDEQGMIEKLLRKRKYDSENADFRERQKTAAFLSRKGFSGEQIQKALRVEEDF